MAFTVEDGTGLDDANAYIEVDYADEYFDDRGITAWTGSSTVKEQAIVRATDYVETRYGNNFAGQREVDGQALSFPRDYIYDFEGNEIEGVPVNLKKAVAEYALRALSAALMPDPDVNDSGRAVKSTRQVVGPIEDTTEFFQGVARLTKPYPAADKLLSSLLVSRGGVIRA